MFEIQYMVSKIPQLLEVVPRMMTIAVVAMILGFVIGFFLALSRLYKVPVISQLSTLYISFVRGTPLLVQMYLLYFGLPKVFKYWNELYNWALPTDFNPFIMAIIIFAIYISAYQAETWYAALNSVDYRQMEAALSIGMNVRQAMLRIIVPQALVNALPNFGNLFITIVKGTSLTFAIQLIDLMAVAKIQAGDDYRYLEMYLIVSLVYWAINIIIERLFIYLERYFSRYKKQATV